MFTGCKMQQRKRRAPKRNKDLCSLDMLAMPGLDGGNERWILVQGQRCRGKALYDGVQLLVGRRGIHMLQDLPFVDVRGRAGRKSRFKILGWAGVADISNIRASTDRAAAIVYNLAEAKALQMLLGVLNKKGHMGIAVKGIFKEMVGELCTCHKSGAFCDIDDLRRENFQLFPLGAAGGYLACSLIGDDICGRSPLGDDAMNAIFRPELLAQRVDACKHELHGV